MVAQRLSLLFALTACDRVAPGEAQHGAPVHTQPGGAAQVSTPQPPAPLLGQPVADAALVAEVRAAISRDPFLVDDLETVAVDVYEGRVRLSGRVGSETERDAMAERARKVVGDAGVIVELQAPPRLSEPKP